MLEKYKYVTKAYNVCHQTIKSITSPLYLTAYKYTSEWEYMVLRIVLDMILQALYPTVFCLFVFFTQANCQPHIFYFSHVHGVYTHYTLFNNLPHLNIGDSRACSQRYIHSPEQINNNNTSTLERNVLTMGHTIELLLWLTVKWMYIYCWCWKRPWKSQS